MWWVAVHAPDLALEAFAAPWGPASAQSPLALQARHRVLAANAAAAARGVQAGQARATALALAPELILGQAQAEREAQALRSLAHALLSFTPQVSLQPPQAVVAEWQASLRCFGGPAALWQRMQATLAPLGHRLHWAQGATALGSLWLARAAAIGQAAEAPPPPGEPPPRPGPAWAQRLAGLPLAVLDLPPAQAEALAALGLHTVGELRRQPRAGLARRLGPELLAQLDRAHGEQPEPRAWVQLPPRFTSQVDLGARTDDTERLLRASEPLLQRLATWARALQVRVPAFTLRLQHESRLRASAEGEPGPRHSRLHLVFAEPGTELAHWQAVLRERLQREPLPHPVIGLALECEAPEHGPPPEGQLFPELASGHQGLLHLLERLQARLGPDAVQCLQPQPGHRPELATRLAPWSAPAAPTAPPGPSEPGRLSRPLWLQEPPQPLREADGRPWWQGQPLRLLQGPERIETGWWDGLLASRDYFIAQPPDGRLLWVYRLRPAPPAGEPGWFLHGRFG